MAQEERSGTIAIVTVHGTNDAAPGEGGRKKWWEPESPFAQALLARLSAQGVSAEIVPHIWSGDNSALARERGAETLAKAIRRHDDAYAGVHVIGHSHGGNVASHAAEIVGWGLRGRTQRMQSLTTVGTPYFKNKFGGREVFGAYAFLALTVVSLVSLAVVTFMSIQQRMDDGGLAVFLLLVPVVVFLATILVFAMVFPIAWRGVRRVSRFKRRNAASSEVLAIWHDNDEAISFLRKMEKFDIRPMPPWAFWRGSRQSAVTIGIWFILITASLSVLWVGYNFAVLKLVDWGVLDPRSPIADAADGRWLAWLGIAFAGALILFGIVYALVRLVCAFGDVVTMPWLNDLVRKRIRGMAFGADSDQGIGEVSTASHTHPTRELVLQGDYADRLRENAAAGANALLESYRWALFTVEGDPAQALNEMATDVMTWKSLVHTTYFDHEDLADIIADHILASRALTAAAPARPSRH